MLTHHLLKAASLLSLTTILHATSPSHSDFYSQNPRTLLTTKSEPRDPVKMDVPWKGLKLGVANTLSPYFATSSILSTSPSTSLYHETSSQNIVTVKYGTLDTDSGALVLKTASTRTIDWDAPVTWSSLPSSNSSSGLTLISTRSETQTQTKTLVQDPKSGTITVTVTVPPSTTRTAGSN
jgi:hypothetical protein